MMNDDDDIISSIALPSSVTGWSLGFRLFRLFGLLLLRCCDVPIVRHDAQVAAHFLHLGRHLGVIHFLFD